MAHPLLRRPWIRALLAGTAVLAATGAVMSYLFFIDWSEWRDALPSEAERAFASALQEAGGGPPFIEIADDGTVVIHRDQVAETGPGFDEVRVLVWSASDDKLVRLEYPRWFVWLKTSSSFNLGTMIVAARRDWAHLDLSIDYGDLRRRGPALLLDERLGDRSRIMVWTVRTGG